MFPLSHYTVEVHLFRNVADKERQEKSSNGRDGQNNKDRGYDVQILDKRSESRDSKSSGNKNSKCASTDRKSDSKKDDRYRYVTLTLLCLLSFESLVTSIYAKQAWADKQWVFLHSRDKEKRESREKSEKVKEKSEVKKEKSHRDSKPEKVSHKEEKESKSSKENRGERMGKESRSGGEKESKRDKEERRSEKEAKLAERASSADSKSSHGSLRRSAEPSPKHNDDRGELVSQKSIIYCVSSVEYRCN